MTKKSEHTRIPADLCTKTFKKVEKHGSNSETHGTLDKHLRSLIQISEKILDFTCEVNAL